MDAAVAVAWVRDAAGRRAPTGVAFPAVVAAVAALVFGHGLGRLPLWRDEAASLAVAERPVGAILASAGRIDVVHTAYYLLLHPLVAFGEGEAWVRLPSLVGAVAAVVLTAELARRLLGLWPAVVAAALLVGNPWLAFYAREARPYAIAAALVCGSAFALLGGRTTPRRAARTTPRRAARTTPRRLVAFTVLGVLATWVHVFDLLPVLALLTAHALVTRRGAAGPALRLSSWAASAAVLVACAAPLALVAALEARQVSWVGTPTAADVGTLLHDAAGSTAAEVAVAVALALTAILIVAARAARSERQGAGALLVTAMAGAAAGPVVLLGVSWAGTPLYVERYVVASAPLLALATAGAVGLLSGVIGAAVTGRASTAGPSADRPSAGSPAVRARDVPTVVARVMVACLVVAVAVGGVPAAVAGPADKTEDLRAAAASVAAAARPGDCVAYDPSWARIGLVHYLRAAPIQPRDVAIDPGPAGRQPVGLFPAELPLAAVESNLAACDRVWVAGYPGPVGRWRPVNEVTGQALAAAADDFTAATPADFGDFRLTLWTAR